jgi:hypothetical protein
MVARSIAAPRRHTINLLLADLIAGRSEDL